MPGLYEWIVIRAGYRLLCRLPLALRVLVVLALIAVGAGSLWTPR